MIGCGPEPKLLMKLSVAAPPAHVRVVLTDGARIASEGECPHGPGRDTRPAEFHVGGPTIGRSCVGGDIVWHVDLHGPVAHKSRVLHPVQRHGVSVAKRIIDVDVRGDR